MRALITILSLYVSFSVQMRQFTIPGTYELNPIDYDFSNTIIVEMWGAGASGSCGYGFSGGSGAYLKALIETKQETFKLIIGKGGISPVCYGDRYNYGFNGTSTQLYTVDKKVELIVNGGTTEYNYQAIVQSTTGSLVQTKMNGLPSASWYYIFGKMCGGNGGSSPFGGLGGNGRTQSIGTNCVKVNPSNDYFQQINGQNPGGGGGSISELSSNSGIVTLGGSGGNGTILVYYDGVKISTSSPTKIPTRFPTRILSIAPTKFPTNSPTRILTRAPTKNPTSSPTKFPTVLPTKRPTMSPTTCINGTNSPTMKAIVESKTIYLLFGVLIGITLGIIVLCCYFIRIKCKKMKENENDMTDIVMESVQSYYMEPVQSHY